LNSQGIAAKTPFSGIFFGFAKFPLSSHTSLQIITGYHHIESRTDQHPIHTLADRVLMFF